MVLVIFRAIQLFGEQVVTRDVSIWKMVYSVHVSFWPKFPVLHPAFRHLQYERCLGTSLTSSLARASLRVMSRWTSCPGLNHVRRIYSMLIMQFVLLLIPSVVRVEPAKRSRPSSS